MESDGKITIDDRGRVIGQDRSAIDLLYAGVDIISMPFEIGETITRYNDLCAEFDKPGAIIKPAERPQETVEEEHLRRTSTWFVPDHYRDIDLRELLLTKCQTREQIQRVEEELAMFEQRQLIPLLRQMIFLVDHLREKSIVWGVGRGSSVSSFVLYLIGVHRIDPLRFHLSVHDFLK